MPFQGSSPNQTFSRDTGHYTGTTAWTQTEAAGRGIEESDHDTHDQDLADAINTSLQKNGANKPTAHIDWGGFKITNIGEPSSAQDAASKNYVDSVAAGQTNFTVRVASTANVTLASAVDNGKTLDSIVLATSDRILLKNQTSASENGIWVVAASGAPSRPTDMDAWAETVGAVVNVTAGTTNAGTSWRSTSNAGGTINSTSLDFVQFGTNVTLPLAVASGGTGATTAATAFAAIKQNASESATGVVELATTAEAATGTDTARAVTPAGVAAAIAASAASGTIPVGSVMPYAGTAAPTGWILCYGQNISRATYSTLFGVISTTYGTGDGSTTFTLPDLRGRVVAGQDDMGGSSANRLTNQTGGVNGDTLGATGGAETHSLTAAQTPSNTIDDTGATSMSLSRATSSHTGTGAPHNNLQPTIILNYIIYAAA